LRVASGGSVPEQDQIHLMGWAMEARLYAEDPATGFLPSIGPLEYLDLPDTDLANGVRTDSGVRQGGEVSLHYDPMIAKLITFADTREDAIDRLVDVLDAQVRVYPVKTNAGFLRRALTHADFRAGEVDTRFIDARLDELAPKSPPAVSYIAAALRLTDGAGAFPASTDPWSVRDGFRANSDAVIELGFQADETRLSVSLKRDGDQLTAQLGDQGYALTDLCLTDSEVHARMDGRTASARVELRRRGVLVASQGETHLIELYNPAALADALEAGGAIKAPMPGKVLSVPVKAGDAVKKGQTLAVLEAMKMEHALSAPRDGVVESVGASEGSQVGDGAVLVTLADE
jgi:3-methylcrotonyl-CoA carboxylase alpha subunit